MTGSRHDASERFALEHVFGAFDQFGEGCVEAAFEFEEDAEAGVDLAAFDRADVVAVEAAAEGDFFLGEAADGARDADGAAERGVLRADAVGGRWFGAHGSLSRSEAQTAAAAGSSSARRASVRPSGRAGIVMGKASRWSSAAQPRSSSSRR